MRVLTNFTRLIPRLRYHAENLKTSARVLLLAAPLASCFVVALVIGCAGGGSSGTGIKNFSGTARTVAGLPVAGLEVAIVGTDVTDATDEQGAFVVSTKRGAGNVELSFTKDAASDVLTVSDLPKGDVSVAIAVELDSETQTVTSSVISVDQDDDDDSGNNGGGSSSSSSSGSISGRLATFHGSILSSSGTPLAGVRITSPELGITVVTDENGNFSIEGVTSDGNVTFVVEGSDFDGNISVANVDGGSSVEVIVEIDDESREVTVDVISTSSSSSSSSSSSGGSGSSSSSSTSASASSSSSGTSSSSSSGVGSSSSSSSTSDPDDNESSSSSSSSAATSSSSSSSSGHEEE